MNRSFGNALMVLVFRLTLAAYVSLTSFVALGVFFGAPDALPEAAMSYMAWLAQQPNAKFTSIAGWIALIATVASIVSGVAMALFAKWGRPVFSAAIVSLISSEAMISLPVLKTPGEYVADSVLSVLAGGLVAMAYCSQVSDRFCREKPA